MVGACVGNIIIIIIIIIRLVSLENVENIIQRDSVAEIPSNRLRRGGGWSSFPSFLFSV